MISTSKKISQNNSNEYTSINKELQLVMDNAPLKHRLENSENPVSVQLGRQLALVWQELERRFTLVDFVQKVETENVSLAEYQLYLQDMRAQVVEGASWLTRAASNMRGDLIELRHAIINHAHMEQSDYRMLEENYLATGGVRENIQNPRQNIGTAALSAYIYHIVSQENPIELFGAVFIFEGLGHMKAGIWSQHLQNALKLPDNAVSFLAYHGEADVDHYENLINIFKLPIITEDRAARIVRAARTIGLLYTSQLANIGLY